MDVLIVCSSCDVSQSPPMYHYKQTRISWWPFSPPHGGNDKHQEGNNKKKCQVIILEGSDVNQNKRIFNTCWTLIWRAHGIWWYEWEWSKSKWRASMMSMDVIHVHAKKGKNMVKSGAMLPLR
jgi:hypothetical protein